MKTIKDPAKITPESERQKADKARFNPTDGIKYVPYPRHVVEAIDILIKYKRERKIPDYVDSEAAWDTVLKTFDIWKTLYPDHYQEFFASQKETWENLINDYAYAEAQGGGGIRKIAEIPEKLYQMLKIMFPSQRWDKKFMYGLAKRLPLLRGFKQK